jgi:hypothetical protein
MPTQLPNHFSRVDTNHDVWVSEDELTRELVKHDVVRGHNEYDRATSRSSYGRFGALVRALWGRVDKYRLNDKLSDVVLAEAPRFSEL